MVSDPRPRASTFQVPHAGIALQPVFIGRNTREASSSCALVALD
jgi:hypothetical protein